MATETVEMLGEAELVRRTFSIRQDHDQAIQAMGRRSGDSWSSIVRRALDVGLAAEMKAMDKRNVPNAGERTG